MSETLRFVVQLVPIHFLLLCCFLRVMLLYLESFGRLWWKFLRCVVNPLHFFLPIMKLTKNSFVFFLIRRLPSCSSSSNDFCIPPTLSIPLEFFSSLRTFLAIFFLVPFSQLVRNIPKPFRPEFLQKSVKIRLIVVNNNQIKS